MNGKKAFTLIELLIVVAIIGILAAIAVPNFLSAQTRAKVSRSFADMRALKLACASYYIDNNKFPDASTGDIARPESGTRRTGSIGARSVLDVVALLEPLHASGGVYQYLLS